MIKSQNKFVVAKGNVTTSQGISVEKNDVGVIKSESKNLVSIFFVRIWKQIDLNQDTFRNINVAKTGNGFSKKICNVCHKLKKTIYFAKNQNAKNNRTVRRPSCKNCRMKMEGINTLRTDRVEWLKKKPHNEPFECPICKKRTIAGVTSKAVLEHNHHTGKPGGWICDSCNTGLGRFKDNVDLLKSAIEFLEKNY